MRRATVVANEQIGENYRRVTFEGQALAGVDWIAGQKVQIAMSEAFVTRTYTPIEWDAKAGRTAIAGTRMVRVPAAHGCEASNRATNATSSARERRSTRRLYRGQSLYLAMRHQ